MIPSPILYSVLRKFGHVIVPCKTATRIRVCNITKDTATSKTRKRPDQWEIIPVDCQVFAYLDRQEKHANN